MLKGVLFDRAGLEVSWQKAKVCGLLDYEFISRILQKQFLEIIKSEYRPKV